MSRSLSSYRCLIVEPAGNLWGSERVLLDFLGSLKSSTWEIAICYPARSPLKRRLDSLDVRAFPVMVAETHEKSPLYRVYALFGLWLTVLRFRPHLIYVNQAGATRLALLAGRPLGVPVISHVRLAGDVGYISSLAPSSSALPVIISISHSIRSLFAVDAPSPTTQHLVLYDPYTPVWDAPVTETSRARPSERPLTICCVGRLAEVKGQDLLLEALGHLRQRGQYIRCIFLGTSASAEFMQHLEKLTLELGLTDQVVWAGFQENVLQTMAESRAVIIPSRLEPLGRVVFEAWDAGTVPVACVAAGGVAEVLERSKGGILYDEPTASSLAQAIEETIKLSDNDRALLVSHGRSWRANNCDPARYADRMVALWEQVVATR